jgi:hypothetical protein
VPPEEEYEIEDEEVPLGAFISDHLAYIIGYPEGDVKPGSNITRAEVATVFFRLLTDELRDEYWMAANQFTDVTSGMWHNNAVSLMNNVGIVTGYADSTFRPNATITRAELAAMAARFTPFMDLAAGSAVQFTDIAGHWASSEILLAAQIGWVSGYADGTFRPNQPITRAEFMTIVNRMLGRMLRSADDLLADQMATWIDNINPSAWFYLAVQEATNSTVPRYREEMVPGMQFYYKYWVEMLPNPDWAALESQWGEAQASR